MFVAILGRGSDVALASENTVAVLVAFRGKEAALGVKNFEAEGMEFSIARGRREAESVLVAQSGGDAVVDGNEVFVLLGEKSLTSARIGQGRERVIGGSET